MASEELLIAGLSILNIGVVLMFLGKVPLKASVATLYQDETVTLAPEGQALFIKRYMFRATKPCTLNFEQKSASGPFELHRISVPITPPADQIGGWGFPHEGIGDDQTRSKELQIRKGSYAIEFVNRNRSPSKTVFTLTMTRKVPLVGWLGDVGSSLFVVAVPILVTALLT